MSVQIKPGHTYRFNNAKGRIVLDLSMADFKSVAGGSWVNSDNQKVCSEWIRQAETEKKLLIVAFTPVGCRAPQVNAATERNAVDVPQRCHRPLSWHRRLTKERRARHRHSDRDRMGCSS